MEITFNTLHFGTWQERIKAWQEVLTTIHQFGSGESEEIELNKWWRKITPDASWKTKSSLRHYVKCKIEDCERFKCNF